MKFPFSKLIVIGRGNVARECLRIAEQFFETKGELLFLFGNSAEKSNLDLLFKNVKNSLIISANNFYIFKEECVKNNTIINYHNALLPKHRGSNAHIWAIWEGDKKTGVTWHQVDCGVDTGAIIVQKEIEIGEMMAMELLQKQHLLAIETLEECLMKLLENKVMQQKEEETKYHFASKLPNDGFLDLLWEYNKIIRFMRSMDCGFARAKVKLSDDILRILKFNFNDDRIELILEKHIVILILKKEKK
ncbi:formyltransferase family protein [Helicobacter canadensis]|uniref:phosphoribosylglycinamide formyltransferase 1 n=1 Tax=Helicobacter canadensis MIT 98-5491 TaxID=537970 RepID=C5ZV25_9HELI|nr:formyltransferase family protein [Helicobacter canadensis]EES88839.1 formyltransferase, putative [Helicobacter canadensis MIT 98-5491]EFR48862.1 formyl transferase [Helicobacter canadensis MIT 98-5491]STP00105.1 putative methionyl-tRNA formyltransferase [Helicobacter canadensis]